MVKPLRQKMPTVAAWIDDLRAAFGNELVDAAIRAGIAGQQTFNARENGHQIGTPIAYSENKAVSLADISLGAINRAGASSDNRKGKRHG